MADIKSTRTTGALPGGAAEMLARESLRELEARFDARFQSVSARFVRVDNRFLGLDERTEQGERRHRTLDERVTTRLEVIGSALSAAEARIDELRERLGALIHANDQARQRSDILSRRILATVLASLAVTVALWVATMTVVLATRPR